MFDPPSHPRRFLARLTFWGSLGLIALAVIGIASVIISRWLIDAVESMDGGAAAERGQIGGYFGGVGAVFSGLALLALVITLLMQQQELRMQRSELAEQREELTLSRAELRRSAQAELRALHMELTKLAMDDPSLAAVWNDYPGLEQEERRQYLFANLVYQHLYLATEWAETTDEEILVHARDMVRSEAFRRYWAAARGMKLSLPEESRERRFALLFESAMTAQPPPTPN
ncbi:DUF6082 family protein [Streptomyces sp. NPDC051940]|uniref:DUF6082 family protein n=1 Tax=Streptomyces sp. NPDC051940 TaxID=3155675 RepID=UPI00344630B8